MANPNFKPGASAVPATQVEISVNARNLKDRDTFSKSDPMCVLFMKSIGTNNFIEIGRTEMIKDSLNPDFVKKFIVDYFFEESQKLRFELYDVDSPRSQLNAHDFLGRLECTLGEIVGAPGNKLDRKLSGLGNNAGMITVRAEELANCKELATIQFSGTKLDKKDFLGKSDPFLVISRGNEDGSFTVVHKTEVIKNNLNPTWRPFSIKVRALCHGNHDRPMKFDCYDWDSDGSSHDFIGAFTTTLKDLQQPSQRYDLVNPKKKAKKKGYKNSGVINVLACRIETDHTFLDYIQGGMEINFTVAVDFTASNGDPRTPQSLHYINPHQPNQYASALMSVGEIIQDYDTDKMFPALGFGAKLQGGQVSHEFFLNGDASNPYCQGIQGIMAAYHRTLQSVQLWGPTNFSPVINHVAKFASAYREGTHYFVLLIITDGVITDMPQTKEAIIKASTLPMSIIIVGVGEAEFDAMEELDADNQRLSAFGRYAERDIVQFVPFREFIGGRYGNSIEMSKAYLAKEVLAEVPDQVTGYMKKHSIKPRPPQQAPAPGPTQTAPPGGQAPNAATAPSSREPPSRPPPPGQPPAGSYGNQAPPPGTHQGSFHGGQAPPQPQGGGYGAPPAQGGYGATPAQGGYGAAPAQGGYGAPPAQAGYGAPPAQGGYGAPPAQGGYGAPPAQGGYGAPPAQGGYGAPPAQGGYGAPPAQGGYGAPPAQGGYGAPPALGGYGASPTQGGYGGPPSGQAPPQGAYGAAPYPQAGQAPYPSNQSQYPSAPRGSAPPPPQRAP